MISNGAAICWVVSVLGTAGVVGALAAVAGYQCGFNDGRKSQEDETKKLRRESESEMSSLLSRTEEAKRQMRNNGSESQTARLIAEARLEAIRGILWPTKEEADAA